MKHFVAITAILVGILMLAVSGCAKKDDSAYIKEISEWQAKRIKGISAEDGWLSLAGLFWLKPGENTFGSDSACAIVLPKSVPAHAGSLMFKDGKVSLTAAKDAGVKVDDSLRISADLVPDTADKGPSIVKIGSVTFFVIIRQNLIGVRVKDTQEPNRLNFAGLKFFPVDPKWKVEAKFEKYATPGRMAVSTVIGTVDTFLCPGEVSFNLAGKDLRLVAMMEPGTDDQLYFMLSDETAGKETYGAGRQLYSALPDSNNNVTLDFNKTINWPCAYTPFATCPLGPAKNRLPVRIEAGEMNYPGKVVK